MLSKNVIRYGLSLLFIGLVFLKIDFETLWAEILKTNPLLFIGAIFILLFQISVLNLRWHTILNAGSQKISFQKSVFINLAGYLANILLIASIGGMIAKSALAIKNGYSVLYAFCATVLDRGLTLIALIVLSIIGLPFWYTLTSFDVTLPSKDILIMFFLLCAITLIILAYIGLHPRIRARILHTRIAKHIYMGLAYIRSPKLVFSTIFYSLIAQCLYFLSNYILGINIIPAGQTLHFLALLPLISLVSSLPISFGGWGVREGAFVYAMGLIGVSTETAFLLSVQTGVVTIIAPFVFSGLYALRYKTMAKNFFEQDSDDTL